MGFTGKGHRSYVWLEKLIWKAFVRYWEYYSIIFDVDYMEGMELMNF